MAETWNTAIPQDWHPDFVADLNRLATKWQMSLGDVAAAWRVYAAECTDQSALVFEFERWVERVERAKAILARKGRKARP